MEITVLATFIKAFVPIFVSMDPIGLLPLYVGLTESANKQKRNKIILLSTSTALIGACAFLFLGKAIFILLGIKVYDFLVAGGILLLVFSIKEIIFASGKKIDSAADSVGVVPLGMPLIAGPAVLTTTLILLDAHGIFFTLAALIANITLVGIVFKSSDFLISVFGKTPLKAVSKLTGILLAAYAVMMIRRGILQLIENI